VHFARNLLALVPKSHKDMVAAVFRTIFAQPDPQTVASTCGRKIDPAWAHRTLLLRGYDTLSERGCIIRPCGKNERRHRT
jgi:hypothetical protein